MITCEKNGVKIYLDDTISISEWDEKYHWDGQEERWDYPMSELGYIFSELENGDREDNHFAIITIDDEMRMYELPADYKCAEEIAPNNKNYKDTVNSLSMDEDTMLDIIHDAYSASEWERSCETANKVLGLFAELLGVSNEELISKLQS